MLFFMLNYFNDPKYWCWKREKIYILPNIVMKHLKMNAVFWQTARRRLTDLRLALRPGTVSPAVARLHQARLPLLHLGRTWPPVTLGSLDHCPPPQELACRKADKKGKKKMNYLFMRTLIEMQKFDPSIVLTLLWSGRQFSSEQLEECECG